MQLNITDRTLEELTEVLAKAKEIGISQSSDFYDVTIRKNVANEIYQLRNMALGIANKRIGNRYIFSGHKTLTRPFDANGDYFGDRGALQVEITKDFFLPININGEEVFYSNDTNNQDPQLLRQEIESLANASQNNLDLSSENQDPLKPRDPASEASNLNFKKRENIFSQLSTLIVGLETNDTKLVQSLLEKLDGSINRMITLRTKIGSIISSVETARGRMDSDFVDHSARRSKLIDADVGELFTDLQRQQTILSTAYKSGQTSLNQSLMDFLK
jgi:flagellar hook-associated protein 3 FlgL